MARRPTETALHTPQHSNQAPAPTDHRKGSYSPQVAEEQPYWLSLRLCSQPTRPTQNHRGAALRFAPFAQPARPPSPTDATPPSLTPSLPQPSSSDRPPANAVPSTALHLLTSTRPPEPQTNRSTAPANRSIRFTSLRFHCAQSVSVVQRKRTRIGAALRFAPFAQPTRRLSYRPTSAKAPIRRRLRKSNHAGSLSAFAHNQPDTPNTTSAALRFAPFAQPARRPTPKTTQQRTASLPPPSREELASFRPPFRFAPPQLHESTRYGSRRCRAPYPEIWKYLDKKQSALFGVPTRRTKTPLHACSLPAKQRHPAIQAPSGSCPPLLTPEALPAPSIPFTTPTAGSKADYRLRPGPAHPKNQTPRRPWVQERPIPRKRSTAFAPPSPASTASMAPLTTRAPPENKLAPCASSARHLRSAPLAPEMQPGKRQ